MNKKNDVIRWAIQDDAQALSVLNEAFNGVKMPVTEIRNSIDGNHELIAVAAVDEEVIGFACAQIYASFCYREPQGEITEVYVREGARRQGVATALVSFLEEGLRGRGVNSIKVLTGRKNDAAIKTYAGAGFVQQNELVFHKALEPK
jgi:ribosomal protein S18 acetylase RimI-like enzyme